MSPLQSVLNCVTFFIEFIIITFGVDAGLDLFQPTGLDAVTELLHRRLDVSHFDSLFALLVERVERISRR